MADWFVQRYLFWLLWVSIAAHGIPLVVKHRFLTAVASLVTEHGPERARVSVVAARGLSSLQFVGSGAQAQ